GGDLRIDGGAAAGLTGTAVVKDGELNFAGYFLQRFQDIFVFHVVDRDVQSVLRSLDELNKMGNNLSVNLGPIGVKEEIEVFRAERRDGCHVQTSICRRRAV